MEQGEKTHEARQIEHTYMSGKKKTVGSQPHMPGQTTKRSSGKYMHGRRGNILAKKQRRTGKKDRGAGKKKRGAGKKKRGAGKKNRTESKTRNRARNRRMRKGRSWHRNKRCKGKFNKSKRCQRKKVRQKRTRRKNLGRRCKRLRRRKQIGSIFCRKRNGPRQGRIIHPGGIHWILSKMSVFKLFALRL